MLPSTCSGTVAVRVPVLKGFHRRVFFGTDLASRERPSCSRRAALALRLGGGEKFAVFYDQLIITTAEVSARASYPTAAALSFSAAAVPAARSASSVPERHSATVLALFFQ